jgi:hypothetical protein
MAWLFELPIEAIFTPDAVRSGDGQSQSGRGK